MRKLRYTDTFSAIYEKAKKTQEQTGLMSRGQVISLQVLFAQEAGVCDHCGVETSLTADHIVPALLLKMLGYNVEREFRIEWYQCLCWTCNSRKGIQVEWNNYRTHFILNRVMRERPTWEYTKLAKEHAKLRDRFQEDREKVTDVHGPKSLIFNGEKHVWVPQAKPV